MATRDLLLLATERAAHATMRVGLVGRRLLVGAQAAAAGRGTPGAEDHGVRRSLARDAVRNRWSVRELESRARAGAPPAGRRRRARPAPALHPDQAAAVELIADALSAALGRDVDVAPAKAAGYRVQISFESLDDALDVARRLRVRAVS